MDETILTWADLELISRRYGVTGLPQSLSTCARRLGISRVEARLMEQRAIAVVVSVQKVLDAIVTAIEFRRAVEAS